MIINRSVCCVFQDSPSNKLLFAKDIPNYRKMVDRFFREVHELPRVSEKEMTTYLGQVSRVCHDNYFIVRSQLFCSVSLPYENVYYSHYVKKGFEFLHDLLFIANNNNNTAIYQ